MLCLHGWKREGVPVYEYSTMKVLTCQHTVWWHMLGHMLTAMSRLGVLEFVTFVLIFMPMPNLESPINQTRMSLDCSCCEVKALTTTPRATQYRQVFLRSI